MGGHKTASNSDKQRHMAEVLSRAHKPTRETGVGYIVSLCTCNVCPWTSVISESSYQAPIPPHNCLTQPYYLRPNTGSDYTYCEQNATSDLCARLLRDVMFYERPGIRGGAESICTML